MESLLTPFGEIKILIDGKEVPYLAQKGGNLDGLCQHVLGRYQITVSFIPYSQERELKKLSKIKGLRHFSDLEVTQKSHIFQTL